MAAGRGMVPEGRRIFPLLTLDQNLAALERPRGESIWDRPRVYEFFHRLAARADRLSGGERPWRVVVID